MAIDFDLTLFIKETQLQHGLRSEDYDRYHAYISNRLATLRKQVNLSNDRKKFLNKKVTPENATDSRHLMLLALYAERCWADAQAILEKCQAQRSSLNAERSKPKGGVPPRDLCVKRLNKSVKWADALLAVAKAVGSPRLQQECEAYALETAGRCAAVHSRFAEAERLFTDARAKYYELRSSSTDAQLAVVQLKVSELDDRVVFCMQQLGEDPAAYSPPAVSAGQGSEDSEFAGAALKWNGRALNVTSIKVKDALREARTVPVEAAKAKVLELPGPVPVGQTNKVLDLMDRRINSYNDALAHARQDLRGAAEGSAAKVALQLIVHYFLFQVGQETLGRTLFLAEVYSRRFRATERAVRQHGRTHAGAVGRGGRKCEIAPTQFASPLEIVRLYEAAADAVEQMELLPGVAGREDVEEMAAVAKAGKLIYTGESWRIVGDCHGRAEQCYRAAMAVLSDVKAMPEAKKLYELADGASLQAAAETVLSSSSNSASTAAGIEYLTDAAPDEVGVAQNVVRFPPDYQATACKPTFVDIASTYIEFPFETPSAGAGSTTEVKERPPTQTTGQQQQQQQQPAAKKKEASSAGKKGGTSGTHDEAGSGNGKKWGWKWGWGS